MKPTPRGPALRRPFTVRPGNCRPRRRLNLQPNSPSAEAGDPLERSANLARVEAILFLAEEPLTYRRIAEVAGLDGAAAARAAIDQLRQLYRQEESPFEPNELAGGVQLLTDPAYQPWLFRIRRVGSEFKLSSAAMETLAVIAYKQPVTRADVEAVRGVQCSDLIRLLMERGLVRTAGRDTTLGRPQLYATTKRFLQQFGLVSLDDLPSIDGLIDG